MPFEMAVFSPFYALRLRSSRFMNPVFSNSPFGLAELPGGTVQLPGMAISIFFEGAVAVSRSKMQSRFLPLCLALYIA